MGPDHPGVSGRTLLSYLARRVSSHGFNEAGRTHSKQSAADATTNLAFLLGLDWRLADGYRQLAAREATRRQLRQAVNDAFLAIEATRNQISVTPRIDSDGSRGIGNMVIFCFDLTLAVIAHRHRRGPDFLIHDSHLYDGVDARQVKAALELAIQVAGEENMQYIVTLNTDDLDKATRLGFDSAPYVNTTVLTDEHAAGGLFGFRF
ncbi:DUF2326 domain-containing protein [Kitasatospora sp. NPDC028055]|uniref:DUF2326 domain-containing protein n=1 Tax=Kitasatospora sp. NPDC028055 TaxID=3155653 RepID=UPI0033F7AD40